MREKALGYGLVLALVIASIVVQMASSGSDATRFVTVALQAATLVVAVRTSGIRGGGVRLAAALPLAAVAAALLLWLVRGDLPRAPVAVVNGLLVAVAPVAIAAGLLRELRETRRVTLTTLPPTAATSSTSAS